MNTDLSPELPSDKTERNILKDNNHSPGRPKNARTS